MQHRFLESKPLSQTSKTKSPRLASHRLVIAIAAVALIAAGCSGGSDTDDGAIATEDRTNSSDDDNGSTSTDGLAGSTSQTGGDADESTDGGASSDPELPPIPGACSTDNVNSELFYAVTNIAADDPDGGLNVRDNYENGEKLATLVEGTVVFADDCYQLEDGTAWFAIRTADEVSGWVNASFLTSRISPLEPTIGGDETVEKVTAVLDALAARRWEVAAEELAADLDFLPLALLLGDAVPAGAGAPEDLEDGEEGEDDGPDLAARLQTYCSVRICDAPYAIVDVRGTYVPDRVSPAVDVNFTYSGGIVTQTFRRVDGDGEGFTLDTLPGQSILAFSSTRPTVAQVAGDIEEAPAGLFEAAEAVRRGLLAETGPGIPRDYMPNEGVVISSHAFIAEAPADRQVVTTQDLAVGRDEERMWGYTDGVGRPILETVDEWFAGYRRNVALLEPDEIGVDERVGLGNTIDNLAVSFPDSAIVELHRAGRGQLSDFNWSSIRLAFELRDREWKLVAITSDTWTV